MSDREGVAAIALMAMYADEVIVAEEDATLRSHLLQFPLFEEMSEADLGALLSGLERRIRKEKRSVVYAHACAAIVPGLRATAFLVAAEIVAADGSLVLLESAYLARLKKDLAVPDDTARRIFEVTELRLMR